MTTDIYCQGDVALALVATLPDDAKRIPGVTIALGEATGHHHSFATAAGVSLHETAAGVMYAQLAVPAVLEHQEHCHVEIPAGIYEIRRKQEVDLVGEVRAVLD